MSDKPWQVACQFLNRFEESRVVGKDASTVNVMTDNGLQTAPRQEYDKAAVAHMNKHLEQLRKFRALAPLGFLGTAAWWLTYARGYFIHGARKNPLEAEAIAAERTEPGPF